MHFQVFAGRHNASPQLIHDSLIVNDPTMRICNPSLKINSDGGSFSFTFPKKHVLWESDKITTDPLFCRRTDYVIIFKDGEWLWEGFPVSYNENLDGDYDVVCDGAYRYMDNVFYPLSNPLNLTYAPSVHYTPLKPSSAGLSAWWSSESFGRFCFFMFMHKICRQYNNRLNDIARDVYEGSVGLTHQKIYCHPTESVIDISGLKTPTHFSRIVNFESCHTALQTRLVDDFGGYFYITKKEIPMADVVSNIFDYNGNSMESQDNDNPSGTKNVLLLNYTSKSLVLEDNIVYLGENLLDYNVSEDFDIATAVIPFGDPYNDDHKEGSATGESRWWLKDDASVFNDIEQRATYQWTSFEFRYGGKVHRRIYSPTGGSRVFLPFITSYNQGTPIYSTRNLKVVRKYGMRDAIVEFDEVAVKFPYTPYHWDNSTYGCPHTDANHWSPGHRPYAAGSYVWHDIEGPGAGQWTHYLYICIRDNYSESSNAPSGSANGDLYWEQIIDLGHIDNSYDFITAWPYYAAQNNNITGWKNLDDYLNSPNYWDSAELIPCDYLYVTSYAQALKILSLDYLENQQFDNLILDVTASMITPNSQGQLDVFSLFGNKLPVASDLFGKNLKPYPVTEININIEDIISSTVTLGGEAVPLSSLLRTKNDRRT